MFRLATACLFLFALAASACPPESMTTITVYQVPQSFSMGGCASGNCGQTMFMAAPTFRQPVMFRSAPAYVMAPAYAAPTYVRGVGYVDAGTAAAIRADRRARAGGAVLRAGLGLAALAAFR